MAKYHGKNATVKKNGVAIAEFNNWSIESSVDLVEGQDFGDTWKTSEAGMMSWSGSMVRRFNPCSRVVCSASVIRFLAASLSFCANSPSSIMGKSRKFWYISVSSPTLPPNSPVGTSR